MFIENILKNFFGIGSEDKKELAKKVARSASNLDFEMAIAAHENWKLRLRSFLAGTSSEKFVAEEICFDPVRGKPCRSGQGQERGRQSRPGGLDWF